MIDEIWKSTAFIVLALQRRANVGPTQEIALPKLFAFGWLNNIGPTLGQRHFLVVKRVLCRWLANIGPTLGQHYYSL